MTTWPRHPVIYEINTWVWLADLSRKHGRRVDLATVPDQEWEAIASRGFDAVWFMGVWERSPAGIGISMRNEGLLADFKTSPPRLCARRQRRLALLRAPLRRRRAPRRADGARHRAAPAPPTRAAADPRLRSQPRGAGPPLGHRASRLLHSRERRRCPHDPASFIEFGGKVFACGRDPYFPAWPDVLQLNAFHPGLRQAVIDTISQIADQCDGIRCDMAMLMLNDIFERTWGGRAGSRPDDDYWTDGDSRDQRPASGVQVHRRGLLGPGVGTAAAGIRLLLRQEALRPDGARACRAACGSTSWRTFRYQERMVRFIENHDEPRAAAAFTDGKDRAAAVMILTLPGARLLHEGQFEGWRVRLPVFLGRRPAEPVDHDLAAFYDRLLKATRSDLFRNGEWRLCERSGWPDNQTLPEHPRLVLGQGRHARARRRELRTGTGPGPCPGAVGRTESHHVATHRWAVW